MTENKLLKLIDSLNRVSFCELINRRTEMKKRFILLFTVLSLSLCTLCPTQGATLEQVKKEHVKKVLVTAEGQQIKSSVNKYSKMYGMDPVLMHAIILTESNYNKNARSSCGATGLMQLMPSTFKARGVGSNIYSVDNNIHAGIKHFSGLYWKYRGDIYLALAAYNMGGGAVDSYKGRVPAAGKIYADKVLYHKNNILNDIPL